MNGGSGVRGFFSGSFFFLLTELKEVYIICRIFVCLVINLEENIDRSIKFEEEILYLKNRYETYFNDALNRMVKFICENKDAYPESNFKCECFGSPLYGNTGLWLGKSKR